MIELGLWLLQLSAKTAIACLTVYLTTLLFRPWLPPQWRHALWLLVFIRGGLAVDPALEISLFQRATASYTIAALQGSELWPATSAGGQSTRPGVPGRNRLGVAEGRAGGWVELGVFLWLAGAAVLALRLLRSHRLLRGQPVGDPRLLELLLRCRNELGLRRTIRLEETPRVSGPAVCGHLRPVVLTPPGYWDNLGAAEVRHVLLHELSHVKLLHPTASLLGRVVCTLHWFNPLVHFALRRLQEEAEGACDQRVLATLGADERRAYGHTLLSLQAHSTAPKGALALFGRRASLQRFTRRIDMIRSFKPTTWRRALLPAVLMLGLSSLLLSHGNAGSHQPGAPSPPPKTSQQETLERMRQLGTAAVSWLVDQGSALSSEPHGGAGLSDRVAWQPDDCPRISALELGELLGSEYLEAVPELDGWGRPFELCFNPEYPYRTSGRFFGVRSAGSDGEFEGESYRPGASLAVDLSADLVWVDGLFLRWPEPAPLGRSAEILGTEGGWEIVGTAPGSHTLSKRSDTGFTFSTTASTDERSLVLVSRSVPAEDWIGRRLTVSARIRAVDVRGRVLLWFRSDSDRDQVVAVGKDRSGPIQGSTGTKTFRVDAGQVVRGVRTLHYGVALEGEGTIEVEEIRLHEG